MGTEIALLHKFQIFALEDMKVMEMEIVSQILQVYLLYHHLVQLEIIVMDKETVSPLMLQFNVQMDGNLMDKVDVSHWSQILHQRIVLQDAQTVLIQTETEDVYQKQLFKISNALLVTWATEMETASKFLNQIP